MIRTAGFLSAIMEDKINYKEEGRGADNNYRGGGRGGEIGSLKVGGKGHAPHGAVENSRIVPQP